MPIARTNHWENPMLNIVLRLGATMLALAGLDLTDLAACPVKEPAPTLTLKSRYTGKVIVDGARRITLMASLDAKGSGSGTLTFDPNIYDGTSATQIAIHPIAIRLHQVHDDEYAAKGRRLYEIKRDSREETIHKCSLALTPPRWFLVVPETKGQPSWLVLTDESGKFHDIVVLE
jgi:hypothetical protein